MPADNSLPMSCIHRLHSPLMLVCAAIAASGCAQLLAQQALPPIKTPDAFASAESFRTEPANWPADQWWTAYGDRQLNTLIDEALQDAPDLMAANARRNVPRRFRASGRIIPDATGECRRHTLAQTS